MKTHCYGHSGHCFSWGILSIAGGALAVMLLWNWLLPAMFGWKEITYLQAGGLLILGRLLFGGFHGRCSHGGGLHHQTPLTAEEREQMHKRFREKWFNCKNEKNSEKPSQQE